MRFWHSSGDLTLAARIRSAVGSIAWLLLAGWALTACMYSQSLLGASQPPVLSGQQRFETQTQLNEPCGLRHFDPGYALFLKKQPPLLFRGLWPSSVSHPLWGGSSRCHPHEATKFAGSSAVSGNEDSWAGGFWGTEHRATNPSAWSQSQSGSRSERSVPENDSPGHIFWIVPAYKVNYLKNVKPLTPREKFDMWARGAYDPLGVGIRAGEASLEHSPRDGFCGYGKGWGGYGKCFGSAELDGNVSSFFGDFVFPVLLHQDPRYFRLGQGPAGKRLLYAVSRVFVTRTDSGGTAVAYAALSGTILAAATSNLYYPRQDRGVGLSLGRVGWDLGGTALYNVAAEFWPDIKHKLDRVF